MKHTYKILSADIKHDVVEKVKFIDVLFQVSLDGEPLYERRLGFNRSTTSEAIKEELDRYIDVLDKELSQKQASEQEDEKDAEAEQTIKDLLN